MTLTPLRIALLTVSDTRNEETDRSGKYLAEQITSAGHTMAEKKIILPDDIYQIRALVSRWVASDNVQVIIISGGTGLTGRDGTPEAIKPLLDKEIEGFGELFRTLSFNEIKTATIQSRALGGIANATFIFCIPGSPGACRTAWEGILKEQLDSRNKPCNFVELMPRLREI
ncbi:Molybdenum cofactor biosynthesis protein MoaB [hydrothermal vent metagenome]|uniref:Molybdenum cofactor biosynthesis protein MoaB n=1 Tax=hydrothermal vent metagenome TaxID=652676 RepID=A0A3B0ZCY8_9ZZZZ